MALNDGASRCQNHCRAWSTRYGASPVTASWARISAGSAVANAARSVATAISEHERGGGQQGQQGAEQRHPKPESGGPQHLASAVPFLRDDHARLRQQAKGAT